MTAMRARIRRAGPVALLLPALAAAVAPSVGAATRTPHLVAVPVTVEPGGSLTLEGSGFPRNARIVLRARHEDATTTRIGSARTGRRGSFTATIQIRPRSGPELLTAVACHDHCRVRASTTFRIVPPER